VFDDVALYRFDYDNNLQKLFVQFPSSMHEDAIEALQKIFSHARFKMEEDEPAMEDRLKIQCTKQERYEGEAHGSFISDLAIAVKHVTMLHVEVAFTQSWAQLTEKVERILDDQSLLGVLALMINEKPQWRQTQGLPSHPVKPATVDDFILISSKSASPFGRVEFDGVVWMHEFTVELCFFEKGWKRCNGDPHKVCDLARWLWRIR
jgi:hypothetical protein